MEALASGFQPLAEMQSALMNFKKLSGNKAGVRAVSYPLSPDIFEEFLCSGEAAAQKLHYFFSPAARGLRGGAKFLHLKEQLLQTFLFPGYSLNFHKRTFSTRFNGFAGNSGAFQRSASPRG